MIRKRIQDSVDKHGVMLTLLRLLAMLTFLIGLAVIVSQLPPRAIEDTLEVIEPAIPDHQDKLKESLENAIR